MPEVILFTDKLRKNKAAWGQEVAHLPREVFTHFLLAGLADLLAILRKANLKTQRNQLKIMQLDGIVAVTQQELEEYLGDAGIFSMALRHLLEKPEHSQDRNMWCIEKACLTWNVMGSSCVI